MLISAVHKLGRTDDSVNCDHVNVDDQTSDTVTFRDITLHALFMQINSNDDHMLCVDDDDLI